jgi:hypothetical protein
MDLLIFACWLAGSGVVLAAIKRFSRRPAHVVVPVDQVSAIRARLAAEHRERVSGTHVSAVRPCDPGVVRPIALSPTQRAAIAQGKKRKG